MDTTIGNKTRDLFLQPNPILGGKNSMCFLKQLLKNNKFDCMANYKNKEYVSL